MSTHSHEIVCLWQSGAFRPSRPLPRTPAKCGCWYFSLYTPLAVPSAPPTSRHVVLHTRIGWRRFFGLRRTDRLAFTCGSVGFSGDHGDVQGGQRRPAS